MKKDFAENTFTVNIFLLVFKKSGLIKLVEL